MLHRFNYICYWKAIRTISILISYLIGPITLYNRSRYYRSISSDLLEGARGQIDPKNEFDQTISFSNGNKYNAEITFQMNTLRIFPTSHFGKAPQVFMQ